MIPVLTLASTAIITFFGHHFGERFVMKNGKKNVRLILKGYQIHHSAFGFLAIILALLFVGSYLMFIFFGYGIGNIWQHKHTHNRIGEKGMVFLTKILK